MTTVTTMQKINQKIFCKRAKESEQTWIKRASRAMGRFFHVPKEELRFGWLSANKSAQYKGFVNLFYVFSDERGYRLNPFASASTDSIGSMTKMIPVDSDIYFTKNPMQAPDQQEKEHLYSYRTIVIDIQARSLTIQKSIQDATALARYGAKVLLDEVNQDLFSGIEPNMIQVSGCSIQVYWSFYPLLAKEEGAASLYQKTVEKLCDYMELWLKQYPELADFQINRSTSANAVGLVRLPESIHSTVAHAMGEEWAHVETYSPKRKTVHNCKELLAGANYYRDLAIEFFANKEKQGSSLSPVTKTSAAETVTEKDLPDIPTAYDDETDDSFHPDDYDLNAIFGEEFFLSCSDIITETEKTVTVHVGNSEKSPCITEVSSETTQVVEPKQEQKTKPVKSSKTVNSFSPLSDDVYNMTPYEASQRYKAIYRLLWKTYPNQIDIGMRDRTLFVLCNIALKFMPTNKMFQFILDANKKLFKVPMPEQEVRLYMQSSIRVTNEDGSKGYKLSTDYICNLLGLDRSQFPRIIDYKKQNLIHAYEKQERRKKKQALIQKAKELYDSGMTYIEIAKAMGKTRQTISTWIHAAEEAQNQKPAEAKTVPTEQKEEAKAACERTTETAQNTKAPTATESSEQASHEQNSHPAKPKAFHPIAQAMQVVRGCIKQARASKDSKPPLTAALCT